MVILLVSRINGSVTNEETNKSVCKLDSQKVQVSLNRTKKGQRMCVCVNGAFKRSRAIFLSYAIGQSQRNEFLTLFFWFRAQISI